MVEPQGKATPAGKTAAGVFILGVRNPTLVHHRQLNAMTIYGDSRLAYSPYFSILTSHWLSDCTLCVAFSVSIFTGTFVSDTHSTVHSCEFSMWTVELYKLSMCCSQWLCTCTAQFAVYCCHCLSHGTITGGTVYSSTCVCVVCRLCALYVIC